MDLKEAHARTMLDVMQTLHKTQIAVERLQLADLRILPFQLERLVLDAKTNLRFAKATVTAAQFSLDSQLYADLIQELSLLENNISPETPGVITSQFESLNQSIEALERTIHA